MRYFYVAAIALIGASGSFTAASQPPSIDGDSVSADTIIEYAESFGDNGDFIRARIVYDLVLRALAKNENNDGIRKTCESLVTHVSPKGITTLNAPFWNCPFSMLDNWHGDIYRLAVEEPVPIVQIGPAYPHVDKPLEGFVDVRFHIEVDGRVTNVTIVKSSHPAFERPVINAVSKWRYRPAREFGEPEPRYNVMQRFSFALEE